MNKENYLPISQATVNDCRFFPKQVSPRYPILYEFLLIEQFSRIMKACFNSYDRKIYNY